MPNDSSTGGFLAPELAPAPVPDEDAALRAFLQATFVGITGLNKDTGVRPLWQPEPPPMPEPSVNWMAFGFDTIGTGGEPYEEPLEDESGIEQQTHELIQVRCQFYGPAAHALTTRTRDGLFVAQNREGMYSAGVGLIRVSAPLHVPEKKNGKWYDRWDMTITMSREVRREYPVLTFLGASAAVVASRGGESVVEGDVVVAPEG